MNLSNLQVGKTYKNYKELCEVLDEPYLSSDSKDSQLEMWASYFKWEKIGKRQFKIIEIYEFPEPYNPNQHKKLSFYAETMYPLIINELYHQSLADRPILFPSMVDYRNNYFKLFGFSTNLKGYPFEKNEKYSHRLIVNEISEFCRNLVYQKFNKAIENTEKIYSIGYKEIYYLESIPVEGKKFVQKIELSDEIHTNIVKSNIYLVLMEMGLNNTFDMYFRHKKDEFTQRLDKYLKQYGYKYHSTAIKVYLPRANVSLIEIDQNDVYTIKAKYNELFNDMSEQDIKIKLNDCKIAINDRILELIQKHNNEKIESFTQAISDSNCPLPIYEALKKDYGENLPKEKYISIYRNLRNKYINECIKLDTETQGLI